MPAAKKAKKEIRTTVRLPRALYDEAQSFVNRNLASADTMASFFVRAIESYVRLLKRRQIDAAFAGMADDARYQKEARLVAGEFATSDWEAFELAEREAAGD
jgi:hypothetical protein